MSGTPPGSTSGIKWEPYTYTFEGRLIDAELGHLEVRERHAVSSSRRITLAFVRLKTTSRSPGPPIVYLAGGPGGSATRLATTARGSAFLAMREAGDVVLLDQRGVGRSEPNLRCPGSLDLPLSEPATYHSSLTAFRKASDRCAAHWTAAGVDVAAYNTSEIVDDIDDLRRALGQQKISLWGASYGSFLALAYLRRYSPSVHRAVLAGVEGPDHTWKLPSTFDGQIDRINRMLASNAQLRSAIPDFRALTEEVFTTAERSPFAIDVMDGGSTKQVVVGRFDIEQFVLGSLGAVADLTVLPRTLLDLKNRARTSRFIQQMAKQLISQRQDPIVPAMSFAVDCAAGASRGRQARITREMRASLFKWNINFPFPEICETWRIRPHPGSERKPIRSTVPVLFMSGSLDARTPPTNVTDIRDGFPNSSHILIENCGHGHDLFVGSDRIMPATLDFMNTGRVTLKTITMPAVRFH